MKKIYIHLMMLAAMVVAGASMTSCNKEEVATGKFKMSINATKGGDNSKQLNLEGTTLNATWAEGEEVTVYKGEYLLGTLTAQTAGSNTTTLNGTLEDDVAENDVLTLKFCSPNYTSQLGTLEYIAANCDYATATITVASVDDGVVRTKESSAAFVNQQAIVKFTLRNNDNTADINATQLVVNVDGTDYTVNSASATNVFYVALPGFENKSVTLTATVIEEGEEEEDTEYEYTKTVSGITFVNGQYYTVAVGMKELCTYTAPTLNTTTVTYSGSAQSFVTAGSATNATIYYKVDYTNKSGSTSYGDWSTSVPSAINAGNYTVYYKVVPNDGYTGGVESTSLGTKTINKANGWVTLSPNSSSDWGWQKTRLSASASISHHGGSLSWSKSGGAVDYLSVSISGNTLNLSKGNRYQTVFGTVTVTSAATNNYNAASATYTCYE